MPRPLGAHAHWWYGPGRVTSSLRAYVRETGASPHCPDCSVVLIPLPFLGPLLFPFLTSFSRSLLVFPILWPCLVSERLTCIHQTTAKFQPTYKTNRVYSYWNKLLDIRGIQLQEWHDQGALLPTVLSGLFSVHWLCPWASLPSYSHSGSHESRFPACTLHSCSSEGVSVCTFQQSPEICLDWTGLVLISPLN